MRFKVAGVRGGGKQIKVEAFVLPKVTANLPTVPVFLVTSWKHLLELEFAYPDYRIPAGIDILLGGKVFSKAVLYAWQVVQSHQSTLGTLTVLISIGKMMYTQKACYYIRFSNWLFTNRICILSCKYMHFIQYSQFLWVIKYMHKVTRKFKQKQGK